MFAVERTSSKIGVWEPDGSWLEARGAPLAEILAMLAHEFRNPLASLQGCAQTLVDRGDDLPAQTRRQLAEVMASQSRRMDWLIRAAAAFGGVGSTQSGDVGLGPVLCEAGAFAAVPVEGAAAAGTVRGSEARLRMAAEAVLLAFGGSAARARVVAPGTVLEVRTTDTDLERGSRRWKLDLASRLVVEEGGRLEMEQTPEGTVARLCFAEGT